MVTPDASIQHLLDGVAAAVALKPAALSMSWGANERDFPLLTCTLPFISESCQAAYESVFSSAGSTLLVAASGDQGAYDGTHPKYLTVNYPASSPEVVGVGGTKLVLDSRWPGWGIS